MILNTVNIRTNDCRGKSTREATENGSKRILRVVVSAHSGPQVCGSAFRMAHVSGGAVEKINLTSREQSGWRLRGSFGWQTRDQYPAGTTGQEQLAHRLSA